MERLFPDTLRADASNETLQIREELDETLPSEMRVNSCHDELMAMRMFEADSTARARLVKLVYLKLYNRMRVRIATDVMFQAYAERGLARQRLAVD